MHYKLDVCVCNDVVGGYMLVLKALMRLKVTLFRKLILHSRMYTNNDVDNDEFSAILFLIE